MKEQYIFQDSTSLRSKFQRNCADMLHANFATTGPGRSVGQQRHARTRFFHHARILRELLSTMEREADHAFDAPKPDPQRAYLFSSMCDGTTED
jgi:hypothetical protein